MPVVARIRAAVRKFDRGTPLELWMFSDPRTGQEVGSYVPGTRSARVGPNVYTRVSRRGLTRLFADYLESTPPDLARAGDGFMCQI